MAASSGFAGGDLGQLRALAKEFEQAADALRGIGSRVEPLMASAWRGRWDLIDQRLPELFHGAERTGEALSKAGGRLAAKAAAIEAAGKDDGSGVGPLLGGAALGPRTAVGKAASNRAPAHVRREAAARVRELGPKRVRAMLEELRFDSPELCELSRDLARSSGQRGTGKRFFDQVVGEGQRPEVAHRAAALMRCGAEDLDPAWVERGSTILLGSYAHWSQGGMGHPPGDSRQMDRWLGTALDTLEANPDGSVAFMTRHRRLFFSFLAGDHPDNHRAAALLARLGDPPAGMTKEAEDALELLLRWKASGKVVLNDTARLEVARLLRGKMPQVAEQAAQHGGQRNRSWDSSWEGYNVPARVQRETLAELMADPACRDELLAGAQTFATSAMGAAADALAAKISAGESVAEAGLGIPGIEQVGALFGALASAPLPPVAFVDTYKAKAQVAKSMLVGAGALLKEGVKSRPEAALAITAGTTAVNVVFDLGMSDREVEAAAEKARQARDAAQFREDLRRELRNDLRHLAVVSVFSQGHFAQTVIACLPDRGGPYGDLYDSDGRFVIPSPYDRHWGLFLRWMRDDAPDLAQAVEVLANELGGSLMEELS